MTRDEAKGNLIHAIRWNDMPKKEALEIAIQALEQEPKTGHWVGIDEEPHEVWECDHCGFVIDGSGCIDPYDYIDTYKYCPNCGCRVVEPQESEVRNDSRKRKGYQ